jgi:DnaK suppressor protein
VPGEVTNAAARRRLLEVRDRLTGRTTEAGVAPIEGDEAERAAASVDRDVVGYDVERVRLRVREIDAAILRVDAGEYGLCLSCGDDIAPKRLEAIPEARHCLACAERLDRRYSIAGRASRPSPYPADQDDER